MLRRRGILVFLAGSALVGAAGPLVMPGTAGAIAAPPGAVRAAGVWGTAIGVPGLGALNKGGNAEVVSVSCTSAVNCAAGGSYKDGHRHHQGFVVTERRGRWGRAAGVPGLGALNSGGNARVVSIVCTSAGSCAAAGEYRASGHRQGFVVTEKNGVWGRAAQVPGLGALNTGGAVDVTQMSCKSAGNCAVIGDYTDGDGHRQGFAADETNGVWGAAIEVPGLGALNQGGDATALSLSCGSAGNCAAVGDYTGSDRSRQGFAVDEKNGVWGAAIEVPGLGALNQGGASAADSVSCASAGNCAAGGFYSDNSGQQGFVASETNGVWGQAMDVPNLTGVNNGTDQPMAFVNSVSCVSPGNCLAGGSYGGPYSWAFTTSETNGVWGAFTNVPGLTAIVTGRWAAVGKVACVSLGNCVVAGDYENAAPVPDSPNPHGFVVSQRSGRWDKAISMPGLRVLGMNRFTDILSVSSGSAGHGTVGGFYLDKHGHLQGFVTQSNAP